MMSVADPTQTYKDATLRRKLLSLRVIGANLLVLIVASAWGGWLDSNEITRELPQSIRLILVLPVMAAYFLFFFSLVKGSIDLIVHFVPDGRIKGTLLKGDKTPAQLAKEFETEAYQPAAGLMMLFVGFFCIGAIVLLAIGGITLVIAIIMFAPALAIAGLWALFFWKES